MAHNPYASTTINMNDDDSDDEFGFNQAYGGNNNNSSTTSFAASPASSTPAASYSDDLLLLPPTSAKQSSSSYQPATQFTQQQQQQKQQPSAPTSRMCAIFAIETYQPYFDVTTQEIITRFKSTILLHNSAANSSGNGWNYFLADILSEPKSLDPPWEPSEPSGSTIPIKTHVKGPDAYGPFWLSTSLIFVLAVTSNFHKYNNSSKDEVFSNDITTLLSAFYVIYSFSFGVPLVIMIYFHCFYTPHNPNPQTTVNAQGVMQIEQPLIKTKLDYISLYSLYGYSWVLFIPAILLCMIPYSPIHWLVLFVSSIFSYLFVVKNILGVISDCEFDEAQSSSNVIPLTETAKEGENLVADDIIGVVKGHFKTKGVIIVGGFGLQLCLLLLLKFMFYKD